MKPINQVYINKLGYAQDVGMKRAKQNLQEVSHKVSVKSFAGINWSTFTPNNSLIKKDFDNEVAGGTDASGSKLMGMIFDVKYH